MKKPVKKIPYIDYECQVGERVQWSNLRGEKFEGVIRSWDDNLALVLMDDGSEIIIEC